MTVIHTNYGGSARQNAGLFQAKVDVCNFANIANFALKVTPFTPPILGLPLRQNRNIGLLENYIRILLELLKIRDDVFESTESYWRNCKKQRKIPSNCAFLLLFASFSLTLSVYNACITMNTTQ